MKKYRLCIMAVALVVSMTMFGGCKKDGEDEVNVDSAVEEGMDVSENELNGLEEAEEGVYYVSSTEEFLAAIGPDREIVVSVGCYNLSDYIEELWQTEGAKWNESHPYVQLEECHDGVEVVIQDVSGLYITGDSVNTADIEFVTESRYAAVLNFKNCSDIVLQMMTMGHTQAGECSGNVLNFSECTNVELFGMDLYGCGVYGIGAENGCADFYVTESIIRECTQGPFSITVAKGVFDFTDCELVESEGYGLYEATENSELSFYGCTFGKMESEGLFFREDIYTEDCVWSEEIENYPDIEPEDEFEEDFEEEDFEEEEDTEEEFDVANWQQISLDNELLEYSYWMGYALINPQSGATEYLPYESPDGSEIDVGVELDEAGLGWIEYKGESYEISWTIDSTYGVSFHSDTLNATGTVYGEPYEEDVIYWMKLTLDGYTFWLY